MTLTRDSLQRVAADVGLHATLYRGAWQAIDPRDGFRVVGGRRMSAAELKRVIDDRLSIRERGAA